MASEDGNEEGEGAQPRGRVQGVLQPEQFTFLAMADFLRSADAGSRHTHRENQVLEEASRALDSFID